MLTRRIPSERFDTLMKQLRQLGFHSCYYTLFYRISPGQQIAPEFAELIDYDRCSPRVISKKHYLFSGDKRALQFQKVYLQRFAEYDKRFYPGDFFELAEYHSKCQGRVEKAIESGLKAHGIEHEYCLAIEDEFRKGLVGFFWLCSPNKELPQADGKLDTLLMQNHKQLVASHYEELNPWTDAQLLSPSSMTVLKLLADGVGSNEIAEQLHLSRRGVEYHIDGLKQKLGASNRIHLVAKALKLGVLSLY